MVGVALVLNSVAELHGGSGLCGYCRDSNQHIGAGLPLRAIWLWMTSMLSTVSILAFRRRLSSLYRSTEGR